MMETPLEEIEKVEILKGGGLTSGDFEAESFAVLKGVWNFKEPANGVFGKWKNEVWKEILQFEKGRILESFFTTLRNLNLESFERPEISELGDFGVVETAKGF